MGSLSSTGSMRASFLIPTLNAEADLRRLLPALCALREQEPLELHVIDSDSQDGTQALLQESHVPFEVIQRSEFQHGATRNRLAARAEGEFLVFLSQDAVPQGPEFLEQLLRPFSDPKIAGVTCRVLPHDYDDPLTRRTVHQAPEASQEERVQALAEGQSVGSLGPAARADRIRFNNVASAIRASVFAQIPFPEQAFGEDSAWAAAVLEAGWKTAFTPLAVVCHAHSYSPTAAYRRYRVDAEFHRTTHGIQVRPRLIDLFRGWCFEMLQDLRFVAAEGRGWLHLIRSPALRFEQVLGQWRGGQDR